MASQKITNILYFPMLVSEDGTAEAATPEKTEVEWEKLRHLPDEKRGVLVAEEMPYKIKTLQELFRLNDSAIGKISLLIRKIFFGELQMAECEAKIGSMLATTNGGDPNQAKAIVAFIQKEILTIQPKPQVEEEEVETKPKVTVHLSILEALSKYEKLGNQLITGTRMKVRSQPEPVRPSLLYWLKYYRDELGVGHHDSVQRGQFLFRSENGKKLSAEERERVGLILKSVEENFPLTIDTERQEIVFPAFQGVMIGTRKEPAAIPANAKIIRGPEFASPENGGLRMGRGTHFGNLADAKPKLTPTEPGGMSFSAPHMFPAEKEAVEKEKGIAKAGASTSFTRPVSRIVSQSASVTTPKVAPQTAPSSPSKVAASATPKFNPFRIHPVSLGEKKKVPVIDVPEAS